MGGSSDGHMNHGALGHCSNGLRCVGQRSDDFVFSLWTQDLTNCEQDPHRGGVGGAGIHYPTRTGHSLQRPGSW